MRPADRVREMVMAFIGATRDLPKKKVSSVALSTLPLRKATALKIILRTVPKTNVTADVRPFAGSNFLES